MIDRPLLRISAVLMLLGQLLYIAVTQFHAGGDANDHPAIFAVYAGNRIWKAVHAGQFVCIAIMLGGLAALPFATSPHSKRARDTDAADRLGMTAHQGRAHWVGRYGAALAMVAVTMYAVLQAVDGIGNVEADHAWATAPGPDKAARFASAEAMRWLEWGVRSYFDFTLGLALVLIAVAVGRSAAIPRAIAYLMALSGLAYLVQGWILGAEGFSETHTSLILAAWALSIAWMTWLLVGSFRSLRTYAAQSPG